MILRLVVSCDFYCVLLQEFKFMGQCRSPSVSPSRKPTTFDLKELSLFEQYIQEGNPFEMQIDNKEEESEDVLASNGVHLFLSYYKLIICLLHISRQTC